MHKRSFWVNFKGYDSKSKPIRAYSTNAAFMAFWGYKERKTERKDEDTSNRYGNAALRYIFMVMIKKFQPLSLIHI